MLFKQISSTTTSVVVKVFETSKLSLTVILFVAKTFLFCGVLKTILFCELSISKLLLIEPRFREGLII